MLAIIIVCSIIIVKLFPLYQLIQVPYIQKLHTCVLHISHISCNLPLVIFFSHLTDLKFAYLRIRIIEIIKWIKK